MPQLSPRTKPLQIEDEVLVEERRSLSRVRSWAAGTDADKPARAMPELNEFPATLSGMRGFGRIGSWPVID
jgi:hypothetical protein